MTFDIIGNGASNRAYRRSGYTYGCNVPQHKFKVNALSIIDNQPITWMKNNNWNPRVPVYCTAAARDYAKKCNRSGDWFAVYEKRERYNAGLYAVEHCVSRATQIHLWGFDSLFSTDVTSQMDAIVPRGKRPPLHTRWRPLWQQLFEQNPNVEFVLHIPQGEKSEVQATNLTIRQESMELA